MAKARKKTSKKKGNAKKDNSNAKIEVLKNDDNLGIDVNKDSTAAGIYKHYRGVGGLKVLADLLTFWAKWQGIRNNKGKGRSLIFTSYTWQNETLTADSNGELIDYKMQTGVCGALGLSIQQVDYMVSLASKKGYPIEIYKQGKSYYHKDKLKELPDSLKEKAEVLKALTPQDLIKGFQKAKELSA